MTKVEKIELEVRQLSERELASFRAWFSESERSRACSHFMKLYSGR